MGNTTSTWKTREYRQHEPPQSVVEKAIQVPYSEPSGRFSAAWIADTGASLLVGGLRGVTPVAYQYLSSLVQDAQEKAGYQPSILPSAFGGVSSGIIDLCQYAATNAQPGQSEHFLATSSHLAKPSVSLDYVTSFGLSSCSSVQTYFFPWASMIPSGKTQCHFTPLITNTIRAWLLLECLFFVYYKYRVRNINQRTIPEDQPVSTTIRRAHIRRQLDHIMTSGKCPILFIREWFNGVEFKDIRHQNLREWAAGCFFNKTLPECTTQEILEIDDNITFIQRSTGLQAHKGHNSKVGSIRFTMDPVRVLHRPQCMYATLFLSGAVQGSYLFYMFGFKQYEVDGMKYWYRPSPTGNLKARILEKFWKKYGLRKTLSKGTIVGESGVCRHKAKEMEYPELDFNAQVEHAEAQEGLVVVVHGVGVGAWTYLSLLKLLLERFPGKDVLVPELPHVSMQLSDHVPSAPTVTDKIEQMQHAHGHARGVFIGHSYGTFVIGHCQKLAPHLVQHCILVDPVCFLIHQLDGPFQFLFSPPSCVFSKLVHFIAQTEPGIVNSLSRNLWWYQSIVWEDHQPSGSSVVQSALDTIAPSATVRNHLQFSAHRIRILWMENLPHAGFLLNHTAMHQTQDCIAPYRMPSNGNVLVRTNRVKCNRPCPAADSTLEDGLLTPSLLFSDVPLPNAPPSTTKQCSYTCVSGCCVKELFNPYCPVRVLKEGVNHSKGHIRDSYWHARLDELSEEEEEDQKPNTNETKQETNHTVDAKYHETDDPEYGMYDMTTQTYQPVIKQYSTLPHLNRAAKMKQTTRCGPPPKP